MKSIYRLMRPSTAMVLECRLARKLRRREAHQVLYVTTALLSQDILSKMLL